MEKLFRYEQVASKIENIIVQHQLKPGDKIPSVRDVCKELNVSKATVVQAYNLLEAKGIIIPRAKSGYYIDSSQRNRLRPLTEQRFIQIPEVIQINTMATAMIKNTRKYGVVNFSSLGPAKEFMPITKMNRALTTAAKETLGDHFLYPFSEGHPRLLTQIALHSLDWSKSLSHEDILVTNGCMEAIMLCLDAVTKPGDIVAIECPNHEGILQCLESKGLRALGISVNPETGLNIDDLEKAINENNIAACVFSPNIQNPVGCSMPEHNKVRLVQLLGEKGIPLIEDDALGEIYFGNIKPLPAKAYDEYDNVIYCSSFSKTLVPGFRIGWVAGGKYHADIARVKYSLNLSTNAILQDAIGRFLESGSFYGHLKKLRATVQHQVMQYRNAVSSYFPAETKISSPVGGYSLWIELPDRIDAIDLQKSCLKKGIGICPGHIFSPSQDFNHYIRINCCPLFTNKIDQALQMMGKLVEEFSALAKPPRLLNA